VLPRKRTDRAVLRAFAGDAWEPRVIGFVIDAVFAAMQPEIVDETGKPAMVELHVYVKQRNTGNRERNKRPTYARRLLVSPAY
jgi:hypothetical protein